MNTIFTDKDVHSRRIGCVTEIALHKHEHLDRAIERAKSDMARKLAMTIVDDTTFFKTSSTDVFGHVILEYRVDAVVMTADEVAALIRSSFTKGVQHVQGFITSPGM